LQTAQADTQTKVCKRACFANAEKNKKILPRFAKIKSADTQGRQRQRTKNHCLQQGFGVMAGEVLLLNFCAIFELRCIVSTAVL